VSPEKSVRMQELLTQESAELEFQLKEMRKRMFDLRFKATSEEVADNKELSRLRRGVARILTVQNQRKRAAQSAPNAERKSDGR